MKIAAIAAATASLALPAATQAAPITTDVVTLDSHSRTKPMSRMKFANHQWYVMTVKGVASFYAPSIWSNPDLYFKRSKRRHGVICGTPEITSTGRTVGADAETMFARPTSAHACADDPMPRTSRKLQIGDGARWYHPTALDGRHLAPRTDHTYSYAIWGQNARPEFRLIDRPRRDNDGTFTISLRAANGNDCASRQWRNFLEGWAEVPAFTSEADCRAQLPAAPAAAS
jgi:hypothetical protein